MKKIYKYYKDRLIEISGKNRSLYAKKISQTYSYDIGRILEGDNDLIQELIDFLWLGKKQSFELVTKSRANLIANNLQKAKLLEANEKSKKKKAGDVASSIKPIDEKTIVPAQVKLLKNLKRTIEDFERETGRYELFVGYPFVEGFLDKDTAVKAPLLLFPINITLDPSESTASLELRPGDNIQLNKVLLTAYARGAKLSLDEMDLEFEDLKSSGFKNIDGVLTYLDKFGFNFNVCATKKGMQSSELYSFDSIKESKFGDPVTVIKACVLGRFPLANSIYNDYTRLEQKKTSTDAIAQLLENKKAIQNKKAQKKLDNSTYTVHSLDYAQESAITELNQSGNLVIYGPPGTGKSQTIVNIITDALIKNKRVLVVSQKRAALDVVFNRLGILNKKAMYIVDPEKAKASFYEGVKNTHLELTGLAAVDMNRHSLRYGDVTRTLNAEIDHLDNISNVLFKETPYGLSLQQMYANSRIISKENGEYLLYEKFLKNAKLVELDYPTIYSAIRTIIEKNRADLYYKRIEMQKANPFVDHINSGLDVHTINAVKTYLTSLINKRTAPYDIAAYSNMRQLLGFYLENGLTTQKQLMPIINYVAKLEKPSLKPKEVSDNFWKVLSEVKEYVGEYYLLSRVLDQRGFSLAVDAIISGNQWSIKLILNALDDYATIKDLNVNLGACSPQEQMVLNFAYENSSSCEEFKRVIELIPILSIYHQIVIFEELYKDDLSKISDFDNIRTRIISLRDEQQKVVFEMCADTFINSYKNLYNADVENNNFLYQITKPQHLWPIRKLVDTYGELLFGMYPVWLLSPESVSQLLPLKPDLFDLILFDEASQVFIESTLPTIYRGKHIAVAGDNKQLRPTAHFVRRFMGNDEDDLDINTQAALEVESLLDLATSRFSSTRLNYHYRSKYEELINFSNYAFYDNKLQVVPNLSKSVQNRPIERIKVDGRWVDRRNEQEAIATVNLIKKIIKDRQNNETIGVITFNAEQGNVINDLIDAECIKDAKFREAIVRERNRKENGEDVSLFVKNLENVQGDERDIIIFSIAYAENEHGKVVSQFGPLNLEGGENRLNVAITRAKNKIYVLTSIEPEQLSVENSKHLGPKLFKKYLEYVRAVSSGKQKEVALILESLKYQGISSTHERVASRMTRELKDALEKQGFMVEVDVGGSANKLTMAIYDKDLDAYLVGIECDYTALNSSPSVLERDVFRPKFLASRGWRVMRVWSRDFWLNKQRVVSQIAQVALSIQNEFKKKFVPNGKKTKK